MYGINASRGQGHGCRFTMCHTSLKMALLLHKEGLVKTTVPITVSSYVKTKTKAARFIIVTLKFASLLGSKIGLNIGSVEVPLIPFRLLLIKVFWIKLLIF